MFLPKPTGCGCGSQKTAQPVVADSFSQTPEHLLRGLLVCNREGITLRLELLTVGLVTAMVTVDFCYLATMIAAGTVVRVSLRPACGFGSFSWSEGKMIRMFILDLEQNVPVAQLD